MRTIFVVILLATGLGLSGCGKDKKDSPGPGSGGGVPQPTPTYGQGNCPIGFYQTPTGCLPLQNGGGNGSPFEQNCRQSGGYLTQVQGVGPVCRVDYDVWNQSVADLQTPQSSGYSYNQNGNPSYGNSYNTQMNENDGYPENWGFGSYQRRRKFFNHPRIFQARPGSSVPRLLLDNPSGIFPQTVQIQGQALLVHPGDKISFRGKGGHGFGRFFTTIGNQQSGCKGVQTTANVDNIVVGVVATAAPNGTVQMSFEELLPVSNSRPVRINSNGYLVWGFAISPYERSNCFDIRQTHFIVSRCTDQTGSIQPCP